MKDAFCERSIYFKQHDHHRCFIYILVGPACSKFTHLALKWPEIIFGIETIVVSDVQVIKYISGYKAKLVKQDSI